MARTLRPRRAPKQSYVQPQLDTTDEEDYFLLDDSSSSSSSSSDTHSGPSSLESTIRVKLPIKDSTFNAAIQEDNKARPELVPAEPESTVVGVDADDLRQGGSLGNSIDNKEHGWLVNYTHDFAPSAFISNFLDSAYCFESLVIPDGEYTDMIIFCGQKLWHCHRIVVCAQSPIIHRKCRLSMDAGEKMYILNLSQWQVSTVKAFVYSIYARHSAEVLARHLSHPQTFASLLTHHVDLLKLANQYQVKFVQRKLLKIFCVILKHMIPTLSGVKASNISDQSAITIVIDGLYELYKMDDDLGCLRILILEGILRGEQMMEYKIIQKEVNRKGGQLAVDIADAFCKASVEPALHKCLTCENFKSHPKKTQCTICQIQIGQSV